MESLGTRKSAQRPSPSLLPLANYAMYVDHKAVVNKLGAFEVGICSVGNAEFSAVMNNDSFHATPKTIVQISSELI